MNKKNKQEKRNIINIPFFVVASLFVVLLAYYVFAAAPTHGTPILNSTFGTNLTTENLTVYNVTTADSESDPVKNIINWYRNDTSITVLVMPFEGGSNATNTSDYSGYSNHGNVSGATWSNTSGYDGFGAYTFDGTSDRIAITDTKNLNLSQTNHTFSVWFNASPAQPNANGRIFDKFTGGTPGAGYALFITNTTGKIDYIERASGLNHITLTSTKAYNDSLWHHVAIVVDVSGKNATMFIDGVVIAKDGLYNGTLIHLPVNLAIGDDRLFAQEFNGVIDDFVIYNFSLNTEQVLLLYQNRTDVLHSSLLTVGDVWNASVTPIDSSGNGTTKVSVKLTILDTAPTIETPVFNVSTVTKTSGIKANTTYRDTESTVGNVSFTWYRNNSVVFTENFTSISTGTIVNTTLNVTFYNRTDLLNVTVIAFDGTTNSTINFSTTLTVANTAPSAETPVFNVTTVTKTSGIAANTTFRDADRDNARVSFRWFRNNSEVFTENITGITVDTIVNSTLNVTFYNRSDLINVTVFADDGNANSTTNFSTTLTVANIVPTHGTPILNSSLGTNTTGENLTVYNITTADTEGDPVKNIYNWYKNHTSITALLMPFEGGSNATNTSDYSGYSNHGNVSGATWSNTSGYDGFGAYTFDGISDRISISDATILNVSEVNHTISVWINASSSQSNNDSHIINKFVGGTPGAGYLLFISNTTGKIRYEERATGLNHISMIPTNAYNDSLWHHVAIVVDVSGKNATMFVDGAVVVTDSYNGTLIDRAAAITIGDDGSFANEFNGTIDDFTIYRNIALSNEQILAIYRNQTNLIDQTLLAINEVWNASVTPIDRSGNGTTKFTTSLTIAFNDPPVIETPVFNGTSITITTGIKTNTTYKDDLGQLGTIRFRWFRNGDEVATENITGLANFTIVNSTLNISSYSKGDLLNVTVTANDGILTSSTATSATISIQPDVPTHGTPILNSTSATNTTRENLTAYNISTVDINSDGVKNIYNWYKNHTSITALLMSFEGGSNATNTSDYSGYSNHGNVSGATWSNTSGYDGFGAYTFDGISDRISISDATILNVSEVNHTFSVWFNASPTQPNNDSRIFDQFTGGTPGAGYVLFMTNTTGKINYQERSTGANIITFASTNAYNNSLWHHVVIVVDVSGKNATMFIDGSVVITDSYNGTLIDRAAALTIGDDGSFANEFNGTIDDFTIYRNIALSNEQILLLYRNRTDLIDQTMTSVNETWNASITPNDRSGDGTTKFTTSLTIRNAPPTVETPVFNGTTITKASGVMANTTYRDDDGDFGTLYFNWFRNGSSVFTENITAHAGPRYLVPTTSYYNLSTETPINLFNTSNFSESTTEGNMFCSSQSGNFFCPIRTVSGSNTVNVSTTIATPSGDNRSVCLNYSDTTKTRPTLTFNWDTALIKQGGYYVLSYYVNHSDDNTSWQMTAVPHSLIRGNAGAVSDTKTNITSWTFRTFVFRMPEDANTTGSFIYTRVNSVNDRICLDDLRLYEVDPLLVNILNISNVTIKDIQGNTYRDGIDYQITGLYNSSFSATTFVNANGSITGTKAKINWLNDSVTPATLNVTYSFVADFGNADLSAQLRQIDVSSSQFYTNLINPTTESYMDIFTNYSQDFFKYMWLSEMRGLRRGTSTGQQNVSNAAYMQVYIDNLHAKIDTYRGGNASLYKPLFWSDMFTEYHNGQEGYQISYGGQNGSLATLKSTVPSTSVFLTWWYNGCPGFMYALTQDFNASNHQTIGVAAGHENNVSIIMWSSFAAGWTDQIIGISDSSWSDSITKADKQKYMNMTLDYGWNARYGLLKLWEMNTSESFTGGSVITNNNTLSDLDDDYSNTGCYYTWGPFHVLNLSSGDTWQPSSRISLNTTWGDDLKISFFAKSAGEEKNVSVRIQFYDTSNTTIATTTTTITSPSLNGTYQHLEKDSISIPASATSVLPDITAPTEMYIDSFSIYQETKQISFP